MAGILPGYEKIVEQRIKEAMEKGEFENLPGKGKPIPLEDDSHVPEDLRLAYKLLKTPIVFLQNFWRKRKSSRWRIC